MTQLPGLRTSLLPVEHLEAELIAAPLASQSSFSNPLDELDPNMTGATNALWRETEGKFLGRFPGMSIDELVLRRDHFWFKPPTSSQYTDKRPLHSFLNNAASTFIDPGMGSPRLHRDPASQPLELRRRWRWLTFALPQDLLLAATGAHESRVNILSPILQRNLSDQGVAETHLHLKAALEFPTLWASLQLALAGDNISAEMLAGPGAEFDEGRQLAPWLLRCAITRLILACFLANHTPRRYFLNKYLKIIVSPYVERVNGTLATLMIRRTIDELYYGQLSPTLSPDFHSLNRLYASLISRYTGGSSGQIPALSSRVPQLDPLALWSPRNPENPEYGFMRNAFEYMESSAGRSDQTFIRLFWQTQRLRVAFYRHIVQRPLTPGLLWFTRTYGRLSKPRKPIPLQTFINSAIRLAGYGLKSLEVRLSPEPDPADLLQNILEFDTACLNHPEIEAGIVFHLSRTRGNDAEKGRPKPWAIGSHDDIGANPSAGCRFATYYSRVRAEALSLASLLRTYPRMLERVRGIDLCTDELGVPLWVVKPLIEHIQQAGKIAETYLHQTDTPVETLRLTVHAGEDFVHLLSGIRRVGEIVEHLKLSEGDRIGHGVALGIGAADWARRSTGLAVPRGERLFDLLWARRVAVKKNQGVLRTWLPWITQEVERLGNDIFGKTVSIIELDQLVTDLHSSLSLYLAGFPNSPTLHANADSTSLLDDWLRNRTVFLRAQVVEHPDIVDEVDLIETLQTTVLSTLAQRGIVVEINPSSNLLIGNLGDLTNHPLWRISPPIINNGEEKQVRVCIGSDDPITFATRLPEEYQLLADAMLEGGLMPQDVDRWLERARSIGLNARFTVPRSNYPLRSLIAHHPNALIP